MRGIGDGFPVLRLRIVGWDRRNGRSRRGRAASETHEWQQDQDGKRYGNSLKDLMLRAAAFDKTLLIHGLTIGSPVLYVKEILQQIVV